MTTAIAVHLKLTYHEVTLLKTATQLVSPFTLGLFVNPYDFFIQHYWTCILGYTSMGQSTRIHLFIRNSTVNHCVKYGAIIGHTGSILFLILKEHGFNEYGQEDSDHMFVYRQTLESFFCRLMLLCSEVYTFAKVWGYKKVRYPACQLRSRVYFDRSNYQKICADVK